jgi:hypothetical protein
MKRAKFEQGECDEKICVFNLNPVHPFVRLYHLNNGNSAGSRL